MDTNSFARLSQINVNEHVEKKGQFSYLSWPYAVAQLRLADPAACWEVRRFDGLPYLNTDAGHFVEVAVTVQGVTLSPVNKTLVHLERLKIVKELTTRQRGRVFGYRAYAAILNEGTSPLGPTR